MKRSHTARPKADLLLYQLFRQCLKRSERWMMGLDTHLPYRLVVCIYQQKFIIGRIWTYALLICSAYLRQPRTDILVFLTSTAFTTYSKWVHSVS